MVTWVLFWGHFEVILWSLWGHFGVVSVVISGSSWGHLGEVTLGYFGVILVPQESFRRHLWFICRSFVGHLGSFEVILVLFWGNLWVIWESISGTTSIIQNNTQ